jgi:hypothetical protein
LITLTAPQFHNDASAADNTTTAIYCDTSPTIDSYRRRHLLSLGNVSRFKADITIASGGIPRRVAWLTFSDSNGVVSRTFGDRARIRELLMDSVGVTPRQ